MGCLTVGSRAVAGSGDVQCRQARFSNRFTRVVEHSPIAVEALPLLRERGCIPEQVVEILQSARRFGPVHLRRRRLRSPKQPRAPAWSLIVHHSPHVPAGRCPQERRSFELSRSLWRSMRFDEPKLMVNSARDLREQVGRIRVGIARGLSDGVARRLTKGRQST